MNDWHLRRASAAIRAGGVVAYPTEAVYGLGCDPQQLEAVRNLLALKRRAPKKGLILIAADYQQIRPYLDIDAATERQLKASWPGPVTWVVPAAVGVSPLLTGGRDRLAVRVTAHPVAAALCRRCDTALVSTSANLSGRQAARSAFAVRRVFNGLIDYLLPGSVGGLAGPTEIRDVLTGAVLRPASQKLESSSHGK